MVDNVENFLILASYHEYEAYNRSLKIGRGTKKNSKKWVLKQWDLQWSNGVHVVAHGR